MRSSPLPRMSRRGRVTVGVLVGVFVLFTLLGWGVNAWTDWLWFDELHYTKVFTTVLTTRLLLFLVIGAAMAVVIGGNLYLAYRLRPLLRPHSSEQPTLDRYRMGLGPLVDVDAVPQRADVRRQGPDLQHRHRLLRLPVPLLPLPAGRRLHRRGARGDRFAGDALRLRRRAVAGRRGPHHQHGPRAPDHLGRRLRALQGHRV